MSLYRRSGSRYWWMYLEPSKQRLSTKFVIEAASPEQSRRNKAMAEALYHKTITERQGQVQGLLPKAPHPFDQYARWYRTHVTSKKRGKEREEMALDVLTGHFGTTPLAALDKPKVMEWMTARAETVSAGTVNRELDVLKHMLALAVPTHLTASPIAGMARLRAARGSKPRPAAILSPAHEAKLLAVLKPPDRALVVVALCTLFRLSDLLDLQWRDVHPRWIEALDTKTGAHVKVPLAKRAKVALAAIPHHKNAVYVFKDRRAGTPSERRNRIKMMLRRACERAKIPYGRAKGGITFHSFRHTGATRMLAAGVDPRTVQELGGWSSLAQVMRYTHPSDAARRSAVEQV